MIRPCDCSACPAYGAECEGCTVPCRFAHCDGLCEKCLVRCHRREDLDQWLSASDGPSTLLRTGPSTGLRTGLSLDMELAPQPPFALSAFVPQLLNGLAIPAALRSSRDLAVGIAKVLTSRGRVSRRALPVAYGPHDLRAQWSLGEGKRLIAIGNDKDGFLERLWARQPRAGIWPRIQGLGFDLATSLNYSIYLDEPRLEHLINIKRTWLTVSDMQRSSTLIPIPHLQWATQQDLARQLDVIQRHGFHTVTLNLQMFKRQGWETVAVGLDMIGEVVPELTILFTGVVGLKRLAQLAAAFPRASFANSSVHYLAQRYRRLVRDGTRLIKDPVQGSHPDLILALNVDLYRQFLDEVRGRQATLEPEQGMDALETITANLQARLGYAPQQAAATIERLAVDEALLSACARWLQSGELDHGLRPAGLDRKGPTLGDLLPGDPSQEAVLNAFLHLADLVYEAEVAIDELVAKAGY